MAICRLVEGMPLALILAAAMLRGTVVYADRPRAGRRRGSSGPSLAATCPNATALYGRSSRIRGVCFHRRSRKFSAPYLSFAAVFSLRRQKKWQRPRRCFWPRLIDKSLLRRSQDGRYDMHELVRQFAHEQLVASGAFPTIQASYTQILPPNCLKQRNLA